MSPSARVTTELPPGVIVDEGAHVPLVVVGCDFRIASSRFRSRLVLADAHAQNLAQQLADAGAANGLVDLSTCNRNEWIVSSATPAWTAALLSAWMQKLLGDDAPPGTQPYVYTGQVAATHVFRVALGRESLVRGERQIAGQVFRAFEQARQRRTSSRILNGLGTIAGRVVRSGERQGLLNDMTKGVHNIALRALEKRVQPGRPLRVAVVGLGEVGRRMRSLLAADPRFTVSACNRTVNSANDDVLPWLQLSSLLASVDAAVVCTGANQVIIQAAQLAMRSGPALFIVDLGIPEQVARDLHENVAIRIGIDELVQLHGQHELKLKQSQTAAAIVNRAVTQFARFCREPDFLDIFAAVQKRNQSLVGQDLERLVEDHFAQLPDELRARLALDLRSIVQNYTHDVFGTIHQAATLKGNTDGGV